jgi:2-dehydro-3-deoxyphosphooctonate aldolase (KDO 8-P synthase)
MPQKKKSSGRPPSRKRTPAPVRAGGVRIGAGCPPALIAGPCVIESPAATLSLARDLCQRASRLGASLIFKASYDKANRTSRDSYRGPGLEKGLEILAEVKERTGVAVLTDVHSVEEAEAAAAVADILQIPAFLCRQTDLIVAAAGTGRAVNIKKGQFLAPGDMRYVLEKAYGTGNRNVLVTERGTSFGYHRLVVDFTALPVLRALGAPVVFDATHSVQTPGGEEGRSGGNREMVPFLARAAAGAGADAFFFEVHRRPASALSDGPNSITPSALESLWPTLAEIDGLTRGGRDEG